MPVDPNDRRGVYNIEYFSGTQASIYIGDVLVDEVTSISYQVSQSRTPLYGYADQLFRDVSKGVVLVQGEFSINFKEAGYLWLILNRYRELMKGDASLMSTVGRENAQGSSPRTGDPRADQNIERLINGELGVGDKNRALSDIAAAVPFRGARFAIQQDRTASIITDSTSAELRGFSSSARADGSRGGLGEAENIFEVFEDKIWQQGLGHSSRNHALEMDRRADEPALNDFDIFVAFGDYVGTQNVGNHTVQKITGVHIIGTSKQVVIDGQPIQEVYSFIGRNIL